MIDRIQLGGYWALCVVSSILTPVGEPRGGGPRGLIEVARNTSRNIVEVIVEGVDNDVNVVVGTRRVVVRSTEGALEECLRRTEWAKSLLRDPRFGSC